MTKITEKNIELEDIYTVFELNYDNELVNNTQIKKT